MIRLRRSFTAEFKLEAASLVLDQGYSVPEASRLLDVAETVLLRWVQQLQSERSGTTPISKALTPEQQKIQELEARINRLYRVYQHFIYQCISRGSSLSAKTLISQKT